MWVRYSQTREVLQMEQDVDLDLLREREDAIRKLEVLRVVILSLTAEKINGYIFDVDVIVKC